MAEVNEEKKMLSVSANPHVRDSITTQKIMLYVIIALLPATFFGIWNFGVYSLAIVISTVASAMLFEYLYEKLLKLPITVTDGSAALTGLLLALNMPPTAPIWLCILGSAFAIIVVKMLFGGLGQNFMNPALGARCFLLISFAGRMTDFTTDAFTGPTPLAMIKNGETVNTFSMVLGRESGTLGETSVIAVVIGACFLILMGVIDLRIPGSYIVSFALFYILFGGHGANPYYLTAQLAGGGLMLGAFFMATDYATPPVTNKGKVIFGIGCGLITAAIRVFGNYAEGVTFSIIIMNLLVPYIDDLTLTKPMGGTK